MRDFIKKYRCIFSAHERRRFIEISILQAFGGVLEMMAVYIMLPFVSALEDIDSILDYTVFKTIHRITNISDMHVFLALLSLFIASLYVGKNIYMFLLNTVQNRYVFRLSAEKSKKVFEILVRQPYSFHTKSNSADLVQASTADIDALFGTVGAVFALVSNIVSMVLIVVVLLKTSVVLTVAAGGLVFLAMFVVNRFLSVRLKMTGEKNRRYNTEKIRWIHETSGGLKGIVVNRRQDFFIEKYEKAAKEYSVQLAKYQVFAGLPRYFMETVILGGMFGFGAIALFIIDDISSMIPIFAMFAMAAYRLISLANTINVSVNTVKYNAKALEIIYNIFEKEYVEKESPCPVSEMGSSLKEGITLYHIGFHFDDTEKWLYKDFSMDIPANKSVAFIGTTGSGKTTLADIIVGIQKPQEGSVRVDGVDVYEHPDWWAKRIGYIPQVIFLSDDSIRANIAYGISEDDIDDEKIKKCLVQAQLSEFVASLPDGLDTIVGENGMRLSGGQRQRIGIARALYNDPPFLVMDEATSALDNETEQAIIEAINGLAGKKTMLIIAHRLTTIKDCDVIYRIENGNAVLVEGS